VWTFIDAIAEGGAARTVTSFVATRSALFRLD